ncbi:hypothetical protein Moror_11854 [Moniliophthora roreri MCA 2997]|uniref:Uncharacterized protein n=2 Tax=Moniliophthora roreri TaxID=221103 RepID=V2X327_MONRO|nr:hypothetical protein Moror_11854 [Moniliophthora roreri MCA 2997]KAI3607649.1 hypothetical protein WG66_004504 [Moniliophthora roreri]
MSDRPIGSGQIHTWGNANEAEIGVWIYFNLVSSNILLPILVVTFTFSKTAKRHATLTNMCMTWILSGIFSLLSFYDGAGKDKPITTLCKAQMSLLFGILPMWSVAVLVMTLYLYGVINECAFLFEHRKLTMPVMLSAPYIVQCAFTLAGAIATVKKPKARVRTPYYCGLHFTPLSNAMSIFVFIICLCIVLLMIQLGSMVFKNWRARRRSAATRLSHIDTQLVIRVLLFGVYVLAGMVCNCIKLFDPYNPFPYMYAAIAGTVVFLIFGTQSDVFRAWCFWKKFDHPRTDGYVRGQMDWLNTSLHPDVGMSQTEAIGSIPTRAPPEPPRAQVVHHIHSTESFHHAHTQSTQVWV